jgi:hypothetical protein
MVKKSLQYSLYVVLVIALFYNQIYAFILAVGLIMILTYLYGISVNYSDIMLVTYISAAILVLLNNSIFDRTIIFYAILPLTFYILGRKYSVMQNKLNLIIFLLSIFTIFSISRFFINIDGSFSFSLASNFYFMTRTGIVQSRLVDDIINVNHIHLSLWVTSSMVMTLSLFILSQKKIYILLLVFLYLIIIVLGSRTSFFSITLIIFLNLYIFYGSKKPARFFALLVLLFAVLYFMASNIHYFQVVFNRFQQLSFEAGSAQAYGLNVRYETHWILAYNTFIENIWGRGYLYFIQLHHGRSTHNEYLGQLISVGLFPTILYYLFMAIRLRDLFVLFLRRSLNIEELVALNLILLYLINGITEQIYVGNTLWISYFFFVLGILTNKHRS